MECKHWYQTPGNENRSKHKGGSVLGILLIVVGAYWILKETGWGIYLPDWSFFRERFWEVYNFLRAEMGELLLPLFLMIVGVLLVAGRRVGGGLLILLALLVFLPGIIIPGILVVFSLPLVLIIIGIMLVKSLL